MNAAFSIFAPLVAVATLATVTAGCEAEAPIAPETSLVSTASADGAGAARAYAMKERSIEEFVFAQGGVAGSGMGASLGVTGGAIVWIDRSLDVAAVIDYAGSIRRREDRWYAASSDVVKAADGDDVVDVVDDVVDITPEPPMEPPPVKFIGRILEQTLPSGRARVVVDLTTTGALGFATNGSDGTFEKIMLGATSYRDVYAATGDSRLLLVYQAPYPGAPIPSLNQLIYSPQPGQYVEQLTFSAHAKSDMPPEIGRANAVFIDYQAFGGLGGSLGVPGTLSGATISFQ